MPRSAVLVAAAALAGAIACSASARPAPAAAPWSIADARTYLRDRATLWFEKRRCALSCHTTHPFVLVDDGSPIRARILDAVRARVARWPDLAWWYDADADKVAESRGSEAVLAAFALAGTPDAARALDNMLAEQRPDGGWSWLDFGLEPWEAKDAELAGAAFAAIAIGRTDGYRPDPDKLAALRRFVADKKRADPGVHDRLMLLWASRFLEGLIDADEARAYAAAARAVQRADGGFSLAALGTWTRRDGTANVADASDGYATAFVAYVLAPSPAAADRAAVHRALCWLVTHQDASGAWIGRSLNDDDAFNRALMSDAATAYAVGALTAAGTPTCTADR